MYLKIGLNVSICLDSLPNYQIKLTHILHSCASRSRELGRSSNSLGSNKDLQETILAPFFSVVTALESVNLGKPTTSTSKRTIQTQEIRFPPAPRSDMVSSSFSPGIGDNSTSKEPCGTWPIDRQVDRSICILRVYTYIYIYICIVIYIYSIQCSDIIVYIIVCMYIYI